MPIERLSEGDRLMLWPDDLWPQEIGALCILEGPPLLDDEGRLRLGSVQEVVASRLHLLPRFRQLLEVPPRRLGGPIWVDAPAFDISEHIGVVEVEAPGDEARLLSIVEELRSRRLSRLRPLWEMWFLTGLSGHRVGLFVKMHHAMADGMAGVAAIAALLDPTPEIVAQPGPPWAPQPRPQGMDLLVDHLRRRTRAWAGRLRGLAHPIRSLRRLVGLRPALEELVFRDAGPPTSLDRVVGDGRRLALVRSRLELVKDIAHTHGATVNEVLLATVAGGLRRLLQARGEEIDGLALPAYVPVSMRRAPGADGNLVGQMVVHLPVGESDPVRRLRLIAAESAERKARPRPEVGKLPHGRVLGAYFVKVLDRQRVNVTTADLPGPPMPLYLAGSRVLEVFPVLPLIGKVTLGVGAVSYDGQFTLTLLADAATYPDLAILAEGVRDELAVLTGSEESLIGSG